MSSETSWLELVLIALSESDLNLLNECNSALTRKLHSAQKCSDKDFILFLADKRKLFRDLELKLTPQKTFLRIVRKNRKQLVALK